MTTKKRDLRIDFFRGLALLTICLNHNESLSGKKVLYYLVYSPIGGSSTAELFVFISGLVFGLVYLKILLKNGYFLLHMKAALRSFQLYLFHLLMLVIILSSVSLFSVFFDISYSPSFVEFRNFFQNDLSIFYRYSSFQYFPFLFDILPLYIILLIVMPFFIYLLSRNWQLAFSVSFGIYIGVQFLQHFGKLASFPFHNFEFHPLAWQFLFFIGMGLGMQKYYGKLSIPYKKQYLYIGLLFLITICIMDKGMDFLKLTGVYAQGSFYKQYFHQRVTLEPMRLIHFLIFCYVVSYFLVESSDFWNSRTAHVFITCGQNSLEVFTLGVILNYLVALLMTVWNGGYVCMLICDAGVVGLSVLFAYFLSWKKANPWQVWAAREAYPAPAMERGLAQRRPSPALEPEGLGLEAPRPESARF